MLFNTSLKFVNSHYKHLRTLSNYLRPTLPHHIHYQNHIDRLVKYKQTRAMSMDSDSGNSWRGVSISEIYGSQSPWGSPEFSLVSPAYNHAVLYHVPSSGCVAGDRPPKPQVGQDKWDQDHVRMPCSSQSLYPVEDANGETNLKKRWDMIESALSKPMRNSEDLANAILSYNTKFRGVWKFRGLHKLFNEYLEEEESQYFFDVTLPEIAKLALALPKLVQAPIPLLKQHKNRSVSLSQQQIASLLANAFFCTFPRRNSTKKNCEYASYPFINFNTYRFYEATDSDSNMEKLKSICHYFRRVVTKVPAGALTFARRSVPARAGPAWRNSSSTLGAVPLHVDCAGTIEDAHGLIQVDFANKYLGGGVLGHGCVQEEIRFVICPELMISMLFTEVLKPNEALMMIGSERYSKYSGYGHTFQWAGDYSDTTPRDSSARRRCAVLAIDAVPYTSVTQEYKKEAITRELNKCWVGVSFGSCPESRLNVPGVATGNWGCGAFGGTAALKSVLQLMACAHARRPMAYYTFGDTQLRDDIIAVYNMLARYNVTVGQLYNHIISFAENCNVRHAKLHSYLEQVLRGEVKPNTSKVNNRNNMSSVTAGSPSVDDAMDTSLTEVISTVPFAVEDVLRNQSPDLFTPEMDESLVELTEKVENTHKDNNINTTTKDSDSSQTTSKLTLLETMEKLDELQGEPNTLLAKKSRQMSISGSNTSMDSKDKSDAAMELKNKISRKITDYFSKKI